MNPEVEEIIECLRNDLEAGTILNLVVGVSLVGERFAARSTFRREVLPNVIETMGEMLEEMSPRVIQ